MITLVAVEPIPLIIAEFDTVLLTTVKYNTV